MDLQLQNAGVLVVGAAQGIGLAIASEFCRESCRVALWDIDPQVTSAAAELKAQGSTQVISAVVDATNLSQVEEATQATIAELGSCQHVVYAAGAGSGKYGFPFWNLQPADWDRVLQVNLLGAVNVAHTFAPVLCEHDQGSLLLLASVAGQCGSQTDPPYSAAKAGLINFMQAAAKDFAPYGIRVNALSPGMVKTSINQSVWKAWHDSQPENERLSYEQWASSKIKQVSPLGRWQTPEEIAAMAVFLASPRCQNVTGQTVNVDGGQIMHS
ncbi:MAG: SDR family oxidoreductase [Pirellulaceae bacterium]